MSTSQIEIEAGERERSTAAAAAAEVEEAAVRIWSWGAGTDGQLGTGTLDDRYLPQPVTTIQQPVSISRVACGGAHSIALTAPQENIIYGFGSARHGQIGDSGTGPHRLRSFNLPRAIHGFENCRIVYICADGDQSAALSVDGQLYTWGRGFGGSSSSHSPCVFPSSLSFSQVALGWNHALLLADGEAYMLGGKHHGLLSSSQHIKIEEQPSTSFALCTSDESFPTPPLEKVSCVGGEKVVHIAAGAEHSALVTEKGKVMTWGWGEHGQLGLGNTDDQTSPQIVYIGFRGRIIGAQIGVYCGSGFTLVVKSL